MRLVGFYTDNSRVFINPDQVSMICEEDPGSLIITTSGDSIRVNDKIDMTVFRLSFGVTTQKQQETGGT